MSDLASALGTLSNTGLEFYAASQGQPITVGTNVIGGVPVTTSSVGSLITPGALSTTTIVLIAIAIVVLAIVLR